MARIYGTPLRR